MKQAETKFSIFGADLEQEQYVALVQKLEVKARQEPRNYQTRVGLLAALGYGYIFLVLAVVLGLIFGLVWLALNLHRLNGVMIKVGIVLVIFAFVILRSLWVTFPKPKGMELTREQAPQLFAMIDELVGRLKTTRFHHVLLDHDFNASVSQVPKLGMLGWQTNYLILGLPLMQALSPEQFRAVVAHELGHLSGNHGRFGGYIYRLHQTWNQLLENFQNDGGSFIFEKFIRWYAPLFSAYSFALRRANEYVADRCATEMTGVAPAGEALVRLEIQGRYLSEQFWPQVYKQAEEQKDPPSDVFSRLSQVLSTHSAPAQATDALTHALRGKTDYDDTHPCLTDRLTAMGFIESESTPEVVLQKLQEPEADLHANVNAAQFYLADSLESLVAQMQQAWQENLAPHWEQRHKQVQLGQGRLQELEARAENGPLPEEEMWERALLTADCRGGEAALPVVRQLLEAHPEHAAGHFLLGQLLLEQKDEDGIAQLERAMQLAEGLTLKGCSEIYSFLKNQGRDDEAKPYRERSEKSYEKIVAAQAERSNILGSDTLLPHGLPAETIAALREDMAEHDKVGEVFLVRKEVEHFPEEPCYVLGIGTRRSVAKFFSSEDHDKLLKEILEDLAAPDGTLVVIFGENTKSVEKAMKKAEGAKIYSYKEPIAT